jgi:hypothetical protein
MDRNSTFNQYYRVESLARAVPSTYKLDKGTDRYVHIVAFNDPKDHQQMIRDYLEDYCKVDPDSSDSILRGLKTDHRMCAHAILTYYLRTEINRRIQVERATPIHDDIPADEPIFKTDMSAIWLISREENVRA